MKCEGKQLQALISVCPCNSSTNACSKEEIAASELNLSSTTAFECDDVDVDSELHTGDVDVKAARIPSCVV